MEIKVKLFGNFREKGPKGLPIGDHFTIQVTDGATISDVLQQLDIAEDEARVVIVNSNIIRDFKFQLNPSDLFVAFPPIGGG